MSTHDFIRVQDEEFINMFIHPAQKLTPNSTHYCFLNKTVEIFFKLKEFPQQKLTKQVTKEKDLTKRVVDQFINKLIADFHRGRSSKSLLSYTQIIISYPYACLFHEPIQSLQSYMAISLSLVQKFELMLAIAYRVQDFHNNDIEIKSLVLENIVILAQSTRADQISIAFTQLGTLVNEQEIEAPTKARPNTMAPHLWNDIYSLGLIFYEIYFSKKANEQSLHSGQMLEKQGSWFGKLINKMTTKVVKDRYRIREIIKILGNAKMSYKLLNAH